MQKANFASYTLWTQAIFNSQWKTHRDVVVRWAGTMQAYLIGFVFTCLTTLIGCELYSWTPVTFMTVSTSRRNKWSHRGRTFMMSHQWRDVFTSNDLVGFFLHECSHVQAFCLSVSALPAPCLSRVPRRENHVTDVAGEMQMTARLGWHHRRRMFAYACQIWSIWVINVRFFLFFNWFTLWCMVHLVFGCPPPPPLPHWKLLLKINKKKVTNDTVRHLVVYKPLSKLHLPKT